MLSEILPLAYAYLTMFHQVPKWHNLGANRIIKLLYVLRGSFQALDNMGRYNTVRAVCNIHIWTRCWRWTDYRRGRRMSYSGLKWGHILSIAQWCMNQLFQMIHTPWGDLVGYIWQILCCRKRVRYTILYHLEWFLHLKKREISTNGLPPLLMGTRGPSE